MMRREASLAERRGSTDPFAVDTGLCEKNTPPEKKAPGKMSPSKHQIGGWRAVSAAGLHGQGSRKRNVFFTDTGTRLARSGYSRQSCPPQRSRWPGATVLDFCFLLRRQTRSRHPTSCRGERQRAGIPSTTIATVTTITTLTTITTATMVTTIYYYQSYHRCYSSYCYYYYCCYPYLKVVRAPPSSSA